MSKLNQNRLGFFALGVIFGGWILGMVRATFRAPAR